MSSAIKILPHYTYDDYVHWEGKWELIDGVPHAMSPAPLPQHQIITGNLLAEFRFQLKKCPQCKVMEPVDYRIGDDTILQPDLLIVCKPIVKTYLDFPPVLVAEVLSPSTALKDRHAKYGYYQDEGVKYYIIIDPHKNEVELYQLEAGNYKLVKQGRDFVFHFMIDSCSVNIDFNEIWN